MKIHTGIHHTIYVGNTNITLVVIEDNVLEELTISSVNRDNKERMYIDAIYYLKHIESNKKALKKELVKKGLWEKGVIKAIKLLYKKVVK